MCHAACSASYWQVREKGYAAEPNLHPPFMHSLPVTVVTQVSANRLVQLQAQCKDWNGPLSVVIYTSVIEISTTVGLSEASRAHLAKVMQDVEVFTLMVGRVFD